MRRLAILLGFIATAILLGYSGLHLSQEEMLSEKLTPFTEGFIHTFVSTSIFFVSGAVYESSLPSKLLAFLISTLARFLSEHCSLEWEMHEDWLRHIVESREFLQRKYRSPVIVTLFQLLELHQFIWAIACSYIRRQLPIVRGQLSVQSARRRPSIFISFRYSNEQKVDEMLKRLDDE